MSVMNETDLVEARRLALRYLEAWRDDPTARQRVEEEILASPLSVLVEAMLMRLSWDALDAKGQLLTALLAQQRRDLSGNLVDWTPTTTQ